MMFSYVHKKTMIPPPIQQTINKQTMAFGYKQNITNPMVQPQQRKQSILLQQQQQQQTVLLQQQQQALLPKMKWGKPIWTFFHVMSQKLKDEYFSLVIKDFIQFVSLICNALPCPICSTHASAYLKSINFNNIKRKEDLINFFVVFHNVVNQRKGYVVLQKDNIPAYETANTVVVLKNFIFAFEDKSRSMKLMADDLARSRISIQFKNWINSNIQYFDP